MSSFFSYVRGLSEKTVAETTNRLRSWSDRVGSPSTLRSRRRQPSEKQYDSKSDKPSVLEEKILIESIWNLSNVDELEQQGSLRPGCRERGRPLSNNNLMSHPMCGRVVGSLMLHYLKLRDIQTVVRLSTNSTSNECVYCRI